MKKITAFLMTLVMLLAVVACTPADNNKTNDDNKDDENKSDLTTYEEFVAADVDSKVVVETYIQAKQSWWEDNGVGLATFYTQNEEGAYFIYNMPCSKEDYDNKLVKGAKIRVSGTKAVWGGELEIVDATYEVLEGSYIAEPIDLTAKLGTEELINYQNRLAAFKGMTIEAIEYKNNEPGDDIYVTLKYNDASYSFCVEVYLTGTDSDVYTTVAELVAGDVVDIEGFVYWYEGINTHITSIKKAA